MFKLVLEKAEEPEIKLLTSTESLKKQESSRKTYTFALLNTPNYWMCRSQQTGKFLKRREYQTTWSVFWDICIQVREQQLELSIEQQFSSVQFSSVQSLRRVWLFATPSITARQASLSITNSYSLLKLTSIELVMPSNHLILCHPLLCLPSIFPSIRVFSNESALRIRWPKYWSFSFSISPSNEYSRLISFRMDWLDLLAVQGTLKILLQHHSSKAPILQHSAFFTVQLSHLYMTTEKP